MQANKENLKILVVDDLEQNLIAVKTILRSVEAELVMVQSGKDALRAILQNEFALILLDVQMPGMNGYELATILSEEESTREIPIIFLSAIDKDEKYALEGYNSGAVDFIFKPINKNILLSKVQVFLELYQQKQTLIEMRQVAEASAAFKAQFLANMSHEIRTPMNAVIGFSDLLVQTNLDDVQEDYVQSIQDSGKLLLQIINDILDVSKIESGNVELEIRPFDLIALLKNTVAMAKASCRKPHLDLRTEIDKELPQYFLGDETRMSQTLINIINNAVKFTEKGSVTVGVKVLSKSDKTYSLEFSVEDTGIGIAPENLSKVFQSFSQADVSTTRKFGGTGLGLSIVQSFVEMMGGQVQLESELGKGTRFFFVIDLDKTDKVVDEDKSDAVDIAILGKLRILVAEDNLTNQKLISIILKKYGYEVLLAENGLEVLEILKNESVDVVFMDMQMPEMDGVECARELQKSHPELPVLALTANVFQEERDLAKSVGMKGFLTKPINRKVMEESLLAVLGGESHEA